MPPGPKSLKPYQQLLDSLREVVAQVKGAGVEVKTYERVERPERAGNAMVEWHITFACDTCGKDFKTILVNDVLSGKLPPVVKPAHPCVPAGTVARPSLLPR